jgi:signal transduction histidine kinase
MYPMGVLVMPTAFCVSTYAIVKHQLMDIRVAITRTGLLVATYLIILGAPFLLGWWGRPWLENVIGREWWLVPLGLCTALATAGPFAYAFLRRQAERRFLKEQRRYQRTLQLAARGMTQVRNVTRLANLITRLVSRTVGMTHASLFLWDQTHERYTLRASHGSKRLAPQSRYGLEVLHPLVAWLSHNRRVLTEGDVTGHDHPSIAEELATLGAELVIPGLIEHRLIGLLVVGPKLTGVGYSTDDLHAFTTLANEAAIAVENAMSYEELIKVNEQLKVASERLLTQERLAAAGQFATGMAHEIKNPLSAIKTFAQYLPERYKDPAFREKFFRIVQEEIDRINTIVEELSDFAKPAPLQLQPVRLPELVEDTLSLLSNQCLKQSVIVHTSFGENGLTVQADPQQLKQVLLNLFLNSLESMAQGGRLEVSSRANGRAVTLRIADNGYGIEPRHLTDVWDPFFTTKERGMGLGLAIVKGIIDRHGGRINLTSSSGKGTVVELSLPMSPAAS